MLLEKNSNIIMFSYTEGPILKRNKGPRFFLRHYVKIQDHET